MRRARWRRSLDTGCCWKRRGDAGAKLVVCEHNSIHIDMDRSKKYKISDASMESLFVDELEFAAPVQPACHGTLEHG